MQQQHSARAPAWQLLPRPAGHLRISFPIHCTGVSVCFLSVLICTEQAMKVISRAAIALTMAVVLTAILQGCTQDSRSKTYHIGLGPWVGFGPLYLAQEKGFFREAGVTVELIVLTGLAERNSALKSNRIDALAAPVDYFVLSAGNNLLTTIVMAIDESNGGDGLVARKDIVAFSDLRGKTVAYQRGLPSEFFLRALLQQHDVKFAELETSDIETAQAGAAFIAGQVDAAVLWEPWLTRAAEQGDGHVLASTKDYPDLIVDCLAFSTQTAKDSPRDVAAMVKAILRAIEYWKQNPDEANRLMAPHFQVDPEKYAQILTGVRFADLARNRQYFGTPDKPGPIFAVAERASKIWMDAKVIQRPVNPAEIVSADFLPSAAQ